MGNNASDRKPKACGGEIMRRTDRHVLQRSSVKVTESGDRSHPSVVPNDTFTTYPDSDPRWGKNPCEQ